MNRKIVINGQFCARRVTGEERFAHEIVTELDKIYEKSTFDLELVVPQNAEKVPDVKNIKIVRFGKAKGSLWEQVFLGPYSMSKRALTLNLCSIMPILKPGIVCVHDIKYKTGIGITGKMNLYKRLSRLWHLFQYNLAWKYSPLILTVSEFSKSQITKVYHVSPERILVIGNGWDHFKRIAFDDAVFDRNKNWFVKPYFFSVSSVTPNKNLNWIIQVAKTHPHYNFLVSGNISKKDKVAFNLPDNVVLAGYLTDGEVKSIMRRCKAFLFPSFAEGFGIPPLEALSVGCQAIVSNTTCLPEIFGDSVHYIDPRNPSVNLDEILSLPVASPLSVLNKYTYERSARILADKLTSLS